MPVYIDEKYEPLRTSLVNSGDYKNGFFDTNYDLVSFAAALARRKGEKSDEHPRANGRNVEIPTNLGAESSHQILIDVFAALRAFEAEPGEPLKAALVLSEESAAARNNDFSCYADAGFKIIENRKQDEGNYTAAFLEILNELLDETEEEDEA